MSAAGGAVIAEVALASDELRQVLRLHRGAKKYLGFLPDAGFEDRAAVGNLWAYVDSGDVLGYILFDLPGNRVRLVHLCIDPGHRGKGIARALIEELSARYRDRLGIQLKCRRDFPASGFWPLVGFRPVVDLPGRSQDGSLLTIWLRDHGHPDLFTPTDEPRDLIALDQVIVSDLVLDTERGAPSRNLLDSWVQDMAELCVTQQAHVESNNCEDAALRERLMLKLSDFRFIGGSDLDRVLHEKAAALTPDAGDGDHRHLAYAVAGGARYLVTRDDGLLAASDDVSAALGIAVVRPEQLIANLDHARRHTLYEPASLQGTELSEARLAGGDQDQFTTALLSHGNGERRASFRARLRAALAEPDRHHVVAVRSRDGAVRAGFLRARCDDRLDVGLLRVVGSDQTSIALARQIVFSQRLEAAREGVEEIIVSDSCLAPAMMEALEAESFTRVDQGWRCRVECGLRRPEDADLMEAAAMERERWPLKILGAGIPTYMVAIEPVWAERLFDSDLASRTLLHRDLALGLSREHVYYRSPTLGSNITAPGRILWYVRGGRPGHPEGEIRAVSRLVEVVSGPAIALHRRFARLGVWSREEVAAAARNGQVMGLRIEDTELLRWPSGLPELRTTFERAGLRFRPPQSPIEIDDSEFELIYRRSSGYA
jgi:GNAT superfamily N-acetyltransferase/predicted nucleic acid-binding protein